MFLIDNPWLLLSNLRIKTEWSGVKYHKCVSYLRREFVILPTNKMLPINQNDLAEQIKSLENCNNKLQTMKA